ncbi:MAG TPA: hypothetical protein PK831_00595 [Candidatus Magasanikbacteria bacterium]|jgi:predicted mannosyl-3-phosphoglycerate phosphatase (HAD superfamily)|nr:hypothetical protein [Candidatus Magasanikbacteria bacterium]HQF56994.1 hypothetical protein [Candidatus Magasanikbacteria bacterium]HQL52722.1 hypothetical protein [Candidatus Magasanikbacteria bacterium]
MKYENPSRPGNPLMDARREQITMELQELENKIEGLYSFLGQILGEDKFVVTTNGEVTTEVDEITLTPTEQNELNKIREEMKKLYQRKKELQFAG